MFLPVSLGAAVSTCLRGSLLHPIAAWKRQLLDGAVAAVMFSDGEAFSTNTGKVVSLPIDSQSTFLRSESRGVPAIP